MGLDVVLGIVILIAGLRGWLQGFLYQGIRIGGLIACVYLADPVRVQAKPYVLPYLPTLQPELIDRLLWWVSALVSYVVMVGGLTLALKMTKRPEIPGMPPQRSRNDQFAGFLVGLTKGALIAAFLVAALQKYAMDRIETIPWADQQAKSSLAMLWNREYHPASKVWRSVPVRQFVSQIQRMGLPGSAESTPSEAADKAAEHAVVKTARKGAEEGSSRTASREEAKSAPPAPPAPKATKPQVNDPVVAKAVEEMQATIDSLSKPK
jgi:uncharacterized membrane protein required for colicin V production